jgi:multicomponent Na+:H+ antiporter subunit F
MNMLNITLVLMTISIIPCIYRILFGPTIPDRVVGLDAMTLVMVVTIGVYSYVKDSIFFLNAALVLSIIAFVGTVAIAKYLDEGEIF